MVLQRRLTTRAGLLGASTVPGTCVGAGPPGTVASDACGIASEPRTTVVKSRSFDVVRMALPLGRVPGARSTTALPVLVGRPPGRASLGPAPHLPRCGRPVP